MMIFFQRRLRRIKFGKIFLKDERLTLKVAIHNNGRITIHFTQKTKLYKQQRSNIKDKAICFLWFNSMITF